MAVTPSTRRRRRLLAAALAGTPLVVPAWALVSGQRTYDGNHVVSGTAAPVVVAAPEPTPALLPVLTPPVATTPPPVVEPSPEPAPAPEPTSRPVVAPIPAPELPVIEPLPAIDWAALEQLAAFFASLPVDPELAPAEPVDLAPVIEELLP